MTLRSQQDRTAGRIQTLDARLIPLAMDWVERCNTMGWRCLIHQGRRTWAEQDALYAQGRTTPGKIVTNAKAGQGYHNYGLAFDFVAMDKAGQPLWDLTPWEMLGYEGEKLGLEWGGRWKKPDRPHLQLSLAPIATLLKIAPKGFIPSTWTPPPPKAEVA